MQQKNLILGIGILLSFSLLLISATLYFNFQHEEKTKGMITPDMIDDMSDEELKNYIQQRRDNQTTLHSYYFLPFSAFIGLIVGTLIYYLMLGKVTKKENAVKHNAKLVLNFLNSEERRVIKTLMENEGRVRQYEISHLPNLNKVRTHRILNKLLEKGIIEKERLGKINNIRLDKELYNFLKNDTEEFKTSEENKQTLQDN